MPLVPPPSTAKMLKPFFLVDWRAHPASIRSLKSAIDYDAVLDYHLLATSETASYLSYIYGTPPSVTLSRHYFTLWYRRRIWLKSRYKTWEPLSVKSGVLEDFERWRVKLGTSAPTLSRIESGKMPDLQTFGKLCRWLGLDPATLLDIKPQPAETAPYPCCCRAPKGTPRDRPEHSECLGQCHIEGAVNAA